MSSCGSRRVRTPLLLLLALAGIAMGAAAGLSGPGDPPPVPRADIAEREWLRRFGAILQTRRAGTEPRARPMPLQAREDLAPPAPLLVAFPEPGLDPAAAAPPLTPAPSRDRPAPPRQATPSPLSLAATAAPPPEPPGRLRAPPPDRPALTPRRDPITPPLREDERWEEWLVAVRINGELVQEDAYAIRDPRSGRFAVPLEVLEGWRLRFDRERILTFQGMPFYPLDAVPELKVRFDPKEVTLVLEAPAEAFVPFVVEAEAEALPKPDTVTGAFLDYDLDLAIGRGLQDSASGLFEIGAFGRFGVLRTSLLLRNLPRDPELLRLETSWVRDFPDRRTTLRVGDGWLVGGAFGAPARFFGLQYGTNFATDPRFVTFPLPALEALAEQPSVVEVLVNDIQRLRARVPTGPFTIPELPVITGAGEVQLRIRDILGRERTLAQSYYVSTRLLRRGLHDFSYAAGWLREGYGERSFGYGDPFLAVVHRYGFTDAFTGEIYGQLRPGRAGLVAGGSLRIGRFGVLFGGLGASYDRRLGLGAFAEIGYEYLGRSFDLTLKSRYRSAAFRIIGEDGTVRRTDEARLGLQLGTFGRLGLYLLHRDLRAGDDTLLFGGSWSLPLGPGTVILNGTGLLSPRRDLTLTLTYALPLGKARSASTSLTLRDGRPRLRAQFRQGRGASDLGPTFRIAGELGPDRTALELDAGYQGRLAEITGRAEVVDGAGRLRLGLRGSAVLTKGGFALTRRIGRAFGLVEVPGMPGVRVYLDNRLVGRTDARGRLLVPGLTPYEPNRLRVELRDLPLGVVLSRSETVVVPMAGGAVRADFGTFTAREATARLVDEDSDPLPAGLRLADAAGRVRVLIGRAGFARIQGLGSEPTVVVADGPEARYRCPLPAAPAEDPLPDLGTVRCARSASP